MRRNLLGGTALYVFAAGIGRLASLAALLVLSQEREAGAFGAVGLVLSVSSLASSASVAGSVPLSASGNMDVGVRGRASPPVLHIVAALVGVLAVFLSVPEPPAAAALATATAVSVLMQANQQVRAALALRVGQRLPGALGSLSRGLVILGGVLILPGSQPFWFWGFLVAAAELASAVVTGVVLQIQSIRYGLDLGVASPVTATDPQRRGPSRSIQASILASLNSVVLLVGVSLLSRDGNLAEAGYYALAQRALFASTFLMAVLSTPAIAAASKSMDRLGETRPLVGLLRTRHEADVMFFLVGVGLASILGIAISVTSAVNPAGLIGPLIDRGLLIAVGGGAIAQALNSLTSVAAISADRTGPWIASDVVFVCTMAASIPIVVLHPAAASLVAVTACASGTSAVYLFFRLRGGPGGAEGN